MECCLETAKLFAEYSQVQLLLFGLMTDIVYLYLNTKLYPALDVFIGLWLVAVYQHCYLEGVLAVYTLF